MESVIDFACVKKGAGWVFAGEVSPALPAGKQRAMSESLPGCVWAVCSKKEAYIK